VSPHIILFSKNPFHGHLVFIGGFIGGYVTEEFKRNETAVTHDFGHLGDVLTIVYSGSQQELSLEKSGIYLLPENIFSK
jgi:hypothetical protein